MTQPDSVLRLVHAAVTALASGGQLALDNIIRDLDDDELETLIS
ncbi:hypothetical protein ACWDYH_38885 [Nocardia goodfellowii]